MSGTHSDAGKSNRSRFWMSEGQEYEVQAPCCTYQKVGCIAVIMARCENPPTKGSLDTFHLSIDTVDKVLTPSETESAADTVFNADAAAGVVTRIERRFESGAAGVMLRNNLDTRLREVTVTWRKITTHNA